MNVPLIDLAAQYRTIQADVDAAVRQVFESGQFVLGPNVAAFEQEVASYLGSRYAVGVASGTDALILALEALDIGPGDEVILPAYTFFATAEAVMLVGATPVFVDVDAQTYCLDIGQVASRITARTKAVIPVHLYGCPADMRPLVQLAHGHALKVIEDNAQAFGADYRGAKTGGLGDVGCLSFFPSKNLGAYGDAGMVVTSDERLAAAVRMLRTHGWRKKYFPERLGYNSRLDELQAAILRVKLRRLDSWNERRRQLAAVYVRRLGGLACAVPVEPAYGRHVYHLFVIRVNARDQVERSLRERGIGTAVYYPRALHRLQPCLPLGYQEGDFPVAEQASRETLAVPLYPEMAENQLGHVVAALDRALSGAGGAA